MNENSNQERAVGLLQQLGLKEYEAKSFVALSRLPRGTAKEISEISEVPRTRVYDAIRVLETKGLVEIQHSNPQQFRAVSVDEAVGTLRDEYDDRTELLRQTLRDVEPSPSGERTESTHEVWALSGQGAIRNRTLQLVDEAETEVVLVLGSGTIFSEDLVERLRTAQQRGVTVILGTTDEGLRELVQDALPEAEVFVSGLEWLARADVATDETDIYRLLLVDRSTILVSTFHPTPDSEGEEKAVFGRGFDNGLVTIVRRLMATGLLSTDDPGAR